jgi:hypothetical protein
MFSKVKYIKCGKEAEISNVAAINNYDNTFRKQMQRLRTLFNTNIYLIYCHPSNTACSVRVMCNNIRIIVYVIFTSAIVFVRKNESIHKVSAMNIIHVTNTFTYFTSGIWKLNRRSGLMFFGGLMYCGNSVFDWSIPSISMKKSRSSGFLDFSDSTKSRSLRKSM